MKFSVLMSVYDKENPEYLDAALRSLVEQSRLPDEIVVVKDGPLNQALDSVLEAYAYSSEYSVPFKIIALSENVGLGRALNTGIEACTHDIVARADSDDVSVYNRFDLQVAYMEKNLDVAIISSVIQEYDESLSKKLSMRIVPETDADIKSFMKMRSPFNHMAVVYRRSAVREVDSYEHVAYFEDYYLWLKLLIKGKAYNFQEPLVSARAGLSMISRRGGFRYARDIAMFYKKAHDARMLSTMDIVRIAPIRLTVALIPAFVRGRAYTKVLRKKG